MTLSQYQTELCKRISELEDRAHTIFELSQKLELYEFQVYALIKEKWLITDTPGGSTLTLKSLRRIIHEATNFVFQLPITPLELQDIFDLPSDVISHILNKESIKPYRRKKRQGQIQGLFKLGQLIKKETLIQKDVNHLHEKVRHKKAGLLKKYEKHEEELLSRSVSTAERPGEIDDTFDSSTSEQEPTAHRFELDEWQKSAIHALENGEHVFVQAPTGSGKTAIVEEFLKRNLPNGVTLFFAVPIKALANDKFFDFCDLYGRDNVGINTGDITLNPDAPIVIGTTEIVRNILFDRPDAYQVIAYDEAQYLGDKERGGAWEESIIMCNEETRLIFLSGSVANGPVVAGWIEKIKNRKVALFNETVRPVPLRFAFPCVI